MSSRSGMAKSTWGRRGNPVAIQGGHALATRLPRYARNDMVTICNNEVQLTNNYVLHR
jgi:hypothetical protein